MNRLKLRKITAGGQISLPAVVRRRWGAKVVTLEDLGDSLVVRPQPDDPIAAARGALRGRVRASDELRAAAREDEAHAERRRR
jgi:hypothetical protein